MPPDRSAYDEKLQSILRASAAIFAEKGYHQASIRDIARATGVSLSGLYYYFQSKDELLFLIQDHALGTLLANLDRILAGVDDPTEKLRLLIGNHLCFFVNNMAEMKVLSHEAGSLSGELGSVVHQQKRQLTQTVMQILQELRPDSDLDLRVSAFALFGMMNWIYTWYRPGRDLPAEALAEQMARLFLSGFLQEAPLAPPAPRDALASPMGLSMWTG